MAQRISGAVETRRLTADGGAARYAGGLPLEDVSRRRPAGRGSGARTHRPRPPGETKSNVPRHSRPPDQAVRAARRRTPCRRNAGRSDNCRDREPDHRVDGDDRDRTRFHPANQQSYDRADDRSRDERVRATEGQRQRPYARGHGCDRRAIRAFRHGQAVPDRHRWRSSSSQSIGGSGRTSVT